MSGLLSHRMLVVVLIGVLAAAGDACAQTTWYVDDDNCPGPGSGTMADPFCTIQAGIDGATDGDTVVVLDGVYTGVGNRNLDFGGRLITLRSANGAASCIIDCQQAGRGFYFQSGETAVAVVQGFTITNGKANLGGGMYNGNSSPTVTDCVFIGNQATMGGGGMDNYRSNPTVTNCTFTGNQGEDGGGMYNHESSPTVTQCTFSGNTAADYGGGMYNHESSPTVTQCTFSGNAGGWDGGGMYNAESSPTVTNCILWNDMPEEIDNGGLHSMPTLAYSDVQGGYAGTGNIDDDPLFMDADGPDNTFGTHDDNLRLSAGSPCIDAGDNAAVAPWLTTDLDGNPRISHGTVDMGAYERQDEDGDGVIDGSDVCPGFDDNADADNDGVPDGCDDCADTPSCATNIDAGGCAIDSDGDGSPDGCPPAEQEPQGCCGATGPVAPLGLALGMLLLNRLARYRSARRRR